MSNSNYFEHHIKIIQALYQYCLQQLPFCDEQVNEVDEEFLSLLKQLSEATSVDESFQYNGQIIVGRIVSQYQHITPSVNRDLFWFFGGDCLHYMPDDEIKSYQQLDEYLHDHSEETLDFSEAKARIFQLH
jgi:hypothetical protein